MVVVNMKTVQQTLMTIRARVYEERQRELDQKNDKERRTKIGTGDRAEKIRTYNYPQNRVTDHRIGYTVNQLDRIMDGRLDDLMAALQLADQQAKNCWRKRIMSTYHSLINEGKERLYKVWSR